MSIPGLKPNQIFHDNSRMTLVSKKHQRFGLYFVTVGLTLLMVGRLISRRSLPSVVDQGSGIPGAVKVLKTTAVMSSLFF